MSKNLLELLERGFRVLNSVMQNGRLKKIRIEQAIHSKIKSTNETKLYL